MTDMDRQIRTAQHRLWLNRWLNDVAVSLAIGLAALAVLVLVQRLFDLVWPLGGIALAIVGLTLPISMLTTARHRASVEVAAARLDQAAGLRERLSTGQYCRSLADPFARAVVADAERAGSSLSARRHIPLTAPRSWPWTFGSAVLAGLMFLVTPGLLKRESTTQAEQQMIRVEEARADVNRKLDELRRYAEVNPVLQELREELGDLDKQPGAKLRRPDDIRHEALKRIDNLADKVKERRENPSYESVKEMRKLLRAVKTPESAQAPTRKLADALAKGEFKTAREEIKNIQEQLATLKTEQDKELVKKLSQQLEQIAKQIEEAANDEKLKQELKKAGIDEEQANRILESLAKKDLDQVKQELTDSGLDRKQVEKLAKQLARKQQAGSMAKQLAQKMGQAGQAAQDGQMGEAMSGLSQAGEQLSQLEQLEQEMAQLESAMAALENAKDGMGSGEGTGDGMGRGDQPGRGGMGRRGKGRGGLAPEDETAVGFKVERGKVHTGKGAIIEQFLVEGEQVEGEVTSSVTDIVTAAERDASDRINRDRIPRQYQQAVKAYFTNVRRSIRELKLDDDASTPEAAPTSNDASADGE